MAAEKQRRLDEARVSPWTGKLPMAAKLGYHPDHPRTQPRLTSIPRNWPRNLRNLRNLRIAPPPVPSNATQSK